VLHLVRRCVLSDSAVAELTMTSKALSSFARQLLSDLAQLLSDLADPANTVKGRLKFLNALERLGELPVSEESNDVIASAIRGGSSDKGNSQSVLQHRHAAV